MASMSSCSLPMESSSKCVAYRPTLERKWASLPPVPGRRSFAAARAAISFSPSVELPFSTSMASKPEISHILLPRLGAEVRKGWAMIAAAPRSFLQFQAAPKQVFRTSAAPAAQRSGYPLRDILPPCPQTPGAPLLFLPLWSPARPQRYCDL